MPVCRAVALLVLTSNVVNDSPDVVEGTKDVFKFVDGVRVIDVRVIEDEGRPGKTFEVDVVMRAGDVVGEGVEEAGERGGSSDGDTPVSKEVWLVEVVSPPVVDAALGGPFWFPAGPGGPFLLPLRPGAFVFTGSRAARAFRNF
jgi:hypothetical protein